MRMYHSNRGSTGPSEKTLGCIVAAILIGLFGLIIALKCFGANFDILPFLFFFPFIFLILVAVRRADKQSKQPGPSPPYDHSSHDSATHPDLSENNSQPSPPHYAPQPIRQPINDDSHLCDETTHAPESPGEQRASLNQLQSGYQATRKDRKQPSRAYDNNQHKEDLKALVDAGLMTQEEYESLSRR